MHACAAPLAAASAPRRAVKRLLRCAAVASSGAPAPPPRSSFLPWPAPSPAAAQLLIALEAGPVPAAFRAAAKAQLLALAAAASAAAPPAAALTARIAAVRAFDARSLEVCALLSLSASLPFASAGVALHAALPSPSDPPLPRGVSYDALAALLGPPDGGQAATELRAHAGAVVPAGADPATTVRLDGPSGARLYAGSVLFGYFVDGVLAALRAAEAAGGPASPDAAVISALARSTRSEEAWAAAQRRAGALWGLQPDADGGYAAALAEFSTGVSMAPTSAASEFYQDAKEDGGRGAPARAPGEAALTEMPSSGGLLPLRAGTLRDLLAEAAAWGWHLGAAERAMADDARTAGLLTPRPFTPPPQQR